MKISSNSFFLPQQILNQIQSSIRKEIDYGRANLVLSNNHWVMEIPPITRALQLFSIISAPALPSIPSSFPLLQPQQRTTTIIYLLLTITSPSPHHAPQSIQSKAAVSPCLYYIYQMDCGLENTRMFWIGNKYSNVADCPFSSHFIKENRSESLSGRLPGEEEFKLIKHPLPDTTMDWTALNWTQSHNQNNFTLNVYLFKSISTPSEL